MSEALYERYKDALRRGHVAALRGRHDVALDAYGEASQLAPDRALPYVGIAGVLTRLGHDSEALAAYDAALDRAPDRRGRPPRPGRSPRQGWRPDRCSRDPGPPRHVARGCRPARRRHRCRPARAGAGRIARPPRHRPPARRAAPGGVVGPGGIRGPGVRDAPAGRAGRDAGGPHPPPRATRPARRPAMRRLADIDIRSRRLHRRPAVPARRRDRRGRGGRCRRRPTCHVVPRADARPPDIGLAGRAPRRSMSATSRWRAVRPTRTFTWPSPTCTSIVAGGRPRPTSWSCWRTSPT